MMNFYSKKAHNGWFIAPTIGYSRFFGESRYISINLHGGYKWELPRSFSIGFGLGPGICRSFVREKKDPWFKFNFFGGLYIGKAFGGMHLVGVNSTFETNNSSTAEYAIASLRIRQAQRPPSPLSTRGEREQETAIF